MITDKNECQVLNAEFVRRGVNATVTRMIGRFIDPTGVTRAFTFEQRDDGLWEFVMLFNDTRIFMCAGTLLEGADCVAQCSSREYNPCQACGNDDGWFSDDVAHALVMIDDDVEYVQPCFGRMVLVCADGTVGEVARYRERTDMECFIVRVYASIRGYTTFKARPVYDPHWSFAGDTVRIDRPSSLGTTVDAIRQMWAKKRDALKFYQS